jgi:hypothetical protein
LSGSGFRALLVPVPTIPVLAPHQGLCFGFLTCGCGDKNTMMLSKGLSLRRLNNSYHGHQQGEESGGGVSDGPTSKMNWMEPTAPLRHAERRRQNEVNNNMIVRDLSEQAVAVASDAPIKRIPGDSFVTLVKSRNFDRIIEILSDRSFRKSELFYWVSFEIPKKNLVLHHILPFQPPVELVSAIASMLMHKIKSDVVNMKQKRQCLDYSEDLLAIAPEQTVDNAGQVPLHVAANNGCDVQIINCLMKTDSDNTSSSKNAAMCRDYSDRFPLHCACSNVKGVRNFDTNLLTTSDHNSSSNKKGGSGWGFALHSSYASTIKNQKENMHKVIEALLGAYPEAVMARDGDGNRPIDIARVNKADTTILHLLQDCARKQRRIQYSAYAIDLNRQSNYRQLSSNQHYHNTSMNKNDQYINPNVGSTNKCMNEQQWPADTENRTRKIIDFLITVNNDDADSVSSLGSCDNDWSTSAEKSGMNCHHPSVSVGGAEESVVSTEEMSFNVGSCRYSSIHQLSQNGNDQELLERDGLTFNHSRAIASSVCYSKARSFKSATVGTTNTRTNTGSMTPQSVKPTIQNCSQAALSITSSVSNQQHYHSRHAESSTTATTNSAPYHSRLISDTLLEC